VKNGDIDCISSHHTGQNLDQKNCEFEYAGSGMVGLESAFGILGILNIDIDKILELICVNPRKIVNLTHTIEVGSTADLTLFNPSIEYDFSASDIKSKSSNTPFIGKKLKGKVLGTILNNNISLK
jgi:dihydroorotase